MTQSPQEGGKREGRLGVDPKGKGLGREHEACGNDTIVDGCPSQSPGQPLNPSNPQTLAQISQGLCGWDPDADYNVTMFLGAFRVPSFSQVLEMPLLLGGGIPTEVKQELQQNFGTRSVWSHWPQLAEG